MQCTVSSVGNASVQGSGRWAALSFGAKHSVGVSGDGEVYTWGRNDSAQLGHNALQQQPMPMRLSVLRGIDVKAICCGSSVRLNQFTAVLTATARAQVFAV